MVVGWYAVPIGASFVSQYAALEIPGTPRDCPRVCKKNNIPGGYRESGEFEILYMNWDLYRKVAQADAVPGSSNIWGENQLEAINLGLSPAASGFGLTNKETASASASK
jgi:hypothetical protein